MRYTALILIIFLFSLTLFAQTPETNLAENTNSAKTSEIKTSETPDEKTQLEEAVAIKTASQRISALQKFIADFPESSEKNRALELIVGARAEIAAEKLRLSDVESSIELFKLAVKEAPTPVTDKLFTGVLLQIPTNVFLRGERGAAFDIADMIEEKIGNDPKQILGLATFYLGIEYATAARRLADKAIALEPESAVAYQTLGLANRVGFNLPKSVEAYEKALELNPDSIVSKRSLAEMKRALGDPEKAISLYREILEKDPKDATARTGLILSLFDNGKQAEAETEMTKELIANSNNVPLLVGAAYWYATQKDGKKAIELATQALQIEPRYTWGYIALARGYMLQKQPLAAEGVLLNARRYGNFPTISYELALAQAAAGFYKEAAEELKSNFRIENGKIVTSLGGRIEAEGDNFLEVLSLERKAGIFEANDANDVLNAEKLRSLLEFENKLNTETIDETELATAADNFVKGDDGMKTHRNLYAANQLLEKKKALPKAIELTQNAVTGVESAVGVASPSSAVLADELYETRNLARTRGQTVVVPDIPTTTLSRIIRGRIEETSGWTLYQQAKYEESLGKLNLAMSILPKDSTWWRSVLWRRGIVLEALEKPKEALDSYIKSYASEIANTQPSSLKKGIVENLYQRVNGNLEGLEEKLTVEPAVQKETTTRFVKQPEEETTANKVKPQKVPDIVPIASPQPKPEATPKLTDTIPQTTPEIITNTPETTIPPEETQKTAEENTTLVVNNQILNPTLEPTKTPETPTVKVIKTQTGIETLSAIVPKESTEVEKPIEEKIETSSVTTPAVETKQPSIFDPVIISVPKVKPATEKKNNETTTADNSTKLEEPKNNTATETESDTTKTEESKNLDSIQTEEIKTEEPIEKPEVKKPEEIKDEKSDEESEPTLIDLGATRPRIVDVNKEEKITKCEIVASQDVVSIINSGGNLGILIGLEGNDNIKDIKAISSSPKDIAVIYDPDIAGVAGQGFFLIKSISENKGAFSVTFKTPCGEKEILVKVR